MDYSQGFRSRMVQRMAGPERISASALSKEVGVTQPTLSRWLREARTLPAMSNQNTSGDDGAKSPRHWRPEEKLEAIVEAGRLSGDALGEFLRRKGLHSTDLERWREEVTEALGKRPRSSGKDREEQRRIRDLERELRQKEKALAELAALLALKKKLESLWGDEDEPTPPRRET